ncbi:MAG: GNAT family N-acetyltransferase, partial [Thermoleophilia bacterium]|nr:GNAT family N-acetyltransferase [Thermoleophilia bacterium]
AWSGGTVRAAAIDDGLAMSIAGDSDALIELRDAITTIDDKMVISGHVGDVELFVSECAGERTLRPEHFMSLTRDQLPQLIEQVPLRVATTADLPLLEEARRNALEEEYGVIVERGSQLDTELVRAVHRAVDMQGVAVWVEAGRVAFTAQLVAKTAVAAMFGDLYTDRELRGQGIATRGLSSFCAWLMSESEHVTLRVGKANAPAVRLYERVGFQEVADFASSLRRDGPLFSTGD